MAAGLLALAAAVLVVAVVVALGDLAKNFSTDDFCRSLAAFSSFASRSASFIASLAAFSASFAAALAAFSCAQQ
jgi:hypothetical protein